MFENYNCEGEPETPLIDVRDVSTPDAPEACQVWLIVGNQQFKVGVTWDSLAEAAWYAQQLTTALKRTGLQKIVCRLPDEKREAGEA